MSRERDEMVIGYLRGHEITTVGSTTYRGDWRWKDTGEPVGMGDRPCTRCGRRPTTEGYDACLGSLPGVVAACCGHGKSQPYVLFADGSGLEDDAAVAWQKQHSSREGESDE